MSRGNTVAMTRAVLICLLTPAVVLLASFPLGIHWFEPGDFSRRQAMIFHGILIPAWMLLMLGSFGKLADTTTAAKWRVTVSRGTAAAALLVGIGALLLRGPGLSGAVVLQVFGMAVADLTALLVIVALSRSRRQGRDPLDRLLWWALIGALGAISLATPLGHLAGAYRDLGARIPMLLAHAGHPSLQSEEASAGYIGSHSHQIVAAFVAAALLLAMLSRERKTGTRLRGITSVGAAIILLATVCQVILYQYSAWMVWEAPNLFVSGPNGIPLDDALLSILGVGFLLLMPALFTGGPRIAPTGALRLDGSRLSAMAGLAFTLSMVGMGIYIEFHEAFFGAGTAGAPGALNDLYYIRAHLIIGCMVLPILMGAFNAIPDQPDRDGTWFFRVAATAVLIAPVAVFVCTFRLSWTLLFVTMALTVLSLLLSASNSLRSIGRSEHPAGESQ